MGMYNKQGKCGKRPENNQTSCDINHRVSVDFEPAHSLGRNIYFIYILEMSEYNVVAF